VATLLTKGTTTRSADVLAATIEGAGGSLSARSGDDFLTISVSALSDRLELAFTLLADVVLRATFAPDELELARTRQLSALALSLSQPGTLAARAFGTEIYGSNPYGRSPTEASYKAITRDDIVTFANARLRPGGALLVVAGDVTRAQVESVTTTAFRGWTGAQPTSPAPVTAPAKRATDILLVHRPGSVQSVIMAGNTTIVPTDPLHYGARLATHVLGGGADSRLFRVLREKESWTYDVQASLHRRRGLGFWSATAQVRTTATDSALVELLHQIQLIRTQAIPDSELAAAKGFLVGSFPLSIETPGQIAGQAATVKLLGLDPDYLRLYRERLSAVTPLAARTAAERVFHGNALTIVVVGDGVALYDRLAAIAPVRIVDGDGHPLSPESLRPPGAALPLDPAQIVAGRDSFQVLVQGNPAGARVTEWRRSADSLVFTESLTFGAPGGLERSVVFDPRDLSVLRVSQHGSAGGQPSEVHIEYRAGRAKGEALVPQESGTPKQIAIDTALAPGTYNENAVSTLLLALPLAPGKTFAIPVYSLDDQAGKVLTLAVGAADSVTVPAGTFHTLPVKVSGGRATLLFQVSATAPRRIVRLAIAEAPVVFELVH
jgi:zinc protease